MNRFALPLLLFLLSSLTHAGAFADQVGPLAKPSLVFAERDGVVAVEAEHFFKQTKTDVRAFHLTHANSTPKVDPDGDPPHVGGASGGAYLEILPDTRRTHADKLIRGKNFSPDPGKLAVVHYRVHISKPGRYYVWVRAHSTGSEDNGLHVGLNGEWPASGQRLQWCEGKRTWRWESKQRTKEKHCGVPHQIYLDIKEPGEHVVHFSMREDGFEFDKWLMTLDRDFKRPAGVGPKSTSHAGEMPKAFAYVKARPAPPQKPVSAAAHAAPLVKPRKPNGDGTVAVTGERKAWHKITLTMDGPFAHERDNKPNPFVDMRMTVVFRHGDGATHLVPGYFAADGDAGDTSAESGTKWRAHFAPELVGKWSYEVHFHRGPQAALDLKAEAKPLAPYHGQRGTLEVAASDKTGRDLRGEGRLQYVGKRYLQFAQSKRYFLKVGADAPETLLGYADFDGTTAGKPNKSPLKRYAAHVKDWREGDPSWKGGKGKGLIGAVNYLSGKGCNAFSFLTYNAGGDGDNVWPFVERNAKLHYDCSKLDQWGVVFDHGTTRGMYLHFKMQETEMDDDRQGHEKKSGNVPTSLDGGKLGVQRKLYCRELIARFGHNLALNWNLGEENTQSTEEQQAMIDYIASLDAYGHNIVIHTFPNQQDKVYRPLLGKASKLTGLSLQNSGLDSTHAQTVKWVRASAAAGKPWVVAFDESGSAAHGQCPDLGYRGFDGRDSSGKMIYTEHEVRKRTLWGVLMAGGAGCEYYFGYKFVENDLVCEDWRSRDRSWDYCRIAINFFRDQQIPFWEMDNADELVGNTAHDRSRFCLAKANEVYLVYLPNGGSAKLDLSGAKGDFELKWFNPKTGGELKPGGQVSGGGARVIGAPTKEPEKQDWLAVIRRK